MGATTFINHGTGTDARTVFTELRDQAAHEYGHGGYTGTIAEKGTFQIVRGAPTRLLEEAVLWADKQLSDYDGNQFWQDKWGDAAAIPIFNPSRQESYGPFDTEGEMSREQVINLVAEKMKADGRLKRGDVVTDVRMSSWHGSKNRTNCQATVTIANDPLARRTVEVKVTVPVDADYNAVDKATWEQVSLRSGERVLEILNTDTTVTYAKPKIKAQATTGKAVTRHVVANSRHETWETGFASQAEARAHAMICAEAYITQLTTNRYARAQARTSFDVSSMTRREDGGPLVAVTCTIDSKTLLRQVVVVKGDTSTLTPNGWLFFGWASE